MCGTHSCFREVPHSCKIVNIKLINVESIFREHVPSLIVSLKDRKSQTSNMVKSL